MKNKSKLLFPIMFVVALAFVSSTNAQDTTKTKHKGYMHNMEMMKDDKMDNKEVNNPIIRSGDIDLQAIDKNKDGYVYQDIMDLNVISDKPGKCPICWMTLKKVSLKKAKDTLIKGGFKVKQ